MFFYLAVCAICLQKKKNKSKVFELLQSYYLIKGSVQLKTKLINTHSYFGDCFVLKTNNFKFGGLLEPVLPDTV